MQKIVIVADRRDRVDELSSLAKALFPECEIHVISESRRNHTKTNAKRSLPLSYGENEERVSSRQRAGL